MNIASQAMPCAPENDCWKHPSTQSTDTPCGDRSPRSPEAKRTPSGRQTRGRLVFAVRKGCPCIDTRLHNPFRPEASGQEGRGRGAAATGASAPRLDASARAAQERISPYRAVMPPPIAGWRQPAIRNIGPNRLQRHGFWPHPVRAALPAAYAGDCKAVFHDDVGSAVEQQVRSLPVAGSNPARHPLDSSAG